MLTQKLHVSAFFAGSSTKMCAIILIIKPTRCTNFSNLFLDWNFTCFGQFLCPSSVVFHCTLNNGICHTSLLTACEQAVSKSCMTYTIAVYTVLVS